LGGVEVGSQDALLILEVSAEEVDSANVRHADLTVEDGDQVSRARDDSEVSGGEGVSRHQQVVGPATEEEAAGGVGGVASGGSGVASVHLGDNVHGADELEALLALQGNSGELRGAVGLSAGEDRSGVESGVGASTVVHALLDGLQFGCGASAVASLDHLRSEQRAGELRVGLEVVHQGGAESGIPNAVEADGIVAGVLQRLEEGIASLDHGWGEERQVSVESGQVQGL